MLDSLVETRDGQRIATRFFRPQGKPKGSVLIVPAMGVTQDYYQPFASWLATQGFIAATFDYRGTGLSRPRALDLRTATKPTAGPTRSTTSTTVRE